MWCLPWTYIPPQPKTEILFVASWSSKRLAKSLKEQNNQLRIVVLKDNFPIGVIVSIQFQVAISTQQNTLSWISLQISNDPQSWLPMFLFRLLHELCKYMHTIRQFGLSKRQVNQSPYQASILSRIIPISSHSKC